MSIEYICECYNKGFFKELQLFIYFKYLMSIVKINVQYVKIEKKMKILKKK